MNKQKGVALFQVLLIITILMLLAIFVSNKAKMQVDSAQHIADKQAAMLDVTTTLAKIKFNLLAYTTEVLLNKNKWNFYGEEFFIGKVKVTIQDHNGLLFINNKTPLKTVKKAIDVAQKMDVSISGVSAETFIDWFSKPKNVRIQNLEQLMSIGFSFDAASKLWSFITTNPRVLFNPMNVPKPLMSVYFESSQSQQLLALRAEKKPYVTVREMTEVITGISNDETTGYIMGPYYRVKISAKTGKSHWNMLYEISIVQRHKGFEIIILSQRPF
ncbi:MAG: hypothetical protein JKY81_06885 [Colwellia sp.]|nr:hypothetical protein [Colwellia sp.]